MKKLLLMRHAAANVQLANEDINRTLSDIGKAEILQAKRFTANIRINKIILSPSMRTRQTMELLFEDFSGATTEVKSELYTANVESMLSIIQKEDDEVESLLVIAHNPAIYQLALKMADKQQDGYEALIDAHMPTSSVVELDFAINYWQEIKASSAKIVRLFRPKGEDE